MDNWSGSDPFMDFRSNDEELPFEDDEELPFADDKQTKDEELPFDNVKNSEKNADSTETASPDGSAGSAEEKYENLTLEKAFSRLDELADRLEKRDIPLEESFRLYKEGMDLLKFCRERIDTVEKKMQVISDDGELTDFTAK